MLITFGRMLIAVLFSVSSYDEERPKHAAHKKPSGVERLSPEIRSLLSQEMLALQKGMRSIIPAYISGNWREIELTAGKMHQSYLLKQNLSDSQKQELHSTLPYAFIKKDQRFHYLAGMLEHAAKNKKPELINFYFSEMNKACLACHSRFATHKFPALSTKKKAEHSH